LSNKPFAFLLGRIQGGTIKIEAKPTRESCIELLDPDTINVNALELRDSRIPLECYIIFLALAFISEALEVINTTFFFW